MKSIKELLNQKVEHKSLGLVEVVEIIDGEEGKFIGRLQTGEVKKFILNPRFFNNVQDYQTKEIKVVKKIDKTRKYKKVDLDKYRKHPLVKEIDDKENKK